jgi:hypothetical protein
MRELVHEREFRSPTDHGVNVHLVELEPAVLCAESRDYFEALSLRYGLGPVVRLEIADDDVATVDLSLLPFLEHAIRLADARCHAEEDAVAAPHGV